RQVVRPELAYPELVQESCLVAEPTRRVERRLVRTLQTPKRIAHQRERVVPRDWFVLVGGGVVAEWLGEPSYCFEVVVAPFGHLAHRVSGEEITIRLRRRKLPRDMLHAVLANIQTESVGVVRPCAPRTVEATVLVIHDEERTESLRRLPGTREHAGDAARRAPSGRRMVVLMSSVILIRHRAATECWLTRHCAEHPLFSIGFTESR